MGSNYFLTLHRSSFFSFHENLVLVAWWDTRKLCNAFKSLCSKHFYQQLDKMGNLKFREQWRNLDLGNL